MEYRQWAAAKNVRTWGDMNMSIYGHCKQYSASGSRSNSFVLATDGTMVAVPSHASSGTCVQSGVAPIERSIAPSKKKEIEQNIKPSPPQ